MVPEKFNSRAVIELGYRSENAIRKALNFVKARTIEKDGKLYFLSVDREDPWYMGIYGASGAILALARIEDRPEMNITAQMCANEIKRQQLANGSWTIRSVKGVSLVTLVCMAARALLELGENSAESPVSKAIDWLLNNQKPDGGWGNFQGDSSSNLNATCHAVRALSHKKLPINKLILEALDRGLSWIIQQKSSMGYWKSMAGNLSEDGSLAHTGLAILTLLDAGISPLSSLLQPGLTWLSSEIDKHELADDNSDSFTIPFDDGTTAGANYIHFTSGVVLSALMTAHPDVSDPRITNLVKSIIDSQDKDGYWISPLAPAQTPTWAIADACYGLHLYTLAIKTIRPMLYIWDAK